MALSRSSILNRAAAVTPWLEMALSISSLSAATT